MQVLNQYGDSYKPAGSFGVDIASQRADDLDTLCLRAVQTLKHPICFDLGCGAGGQALRMAEAGGEVTGVDILDNFPSASHLKFVQQDVLEFLKACPTASADVIISQRMLHYLNAREAYELILGMSRVLKPNGRLFLSASGIQSELGQGYAHTEVTWQHRHCPLHASMQDKHNIQGSVCLYSETDMQNLLKYAGFESYTIFSSPFGNIKATAVKGDIQ